LVAAGLCGTAVLSAEPPKESPLKEKLQPPATKPESILDAKVAPIDLASALQLAGVQNPELLLARERVVEAAAQRQLAAAQFLPTINLGTNFDNHNGPLQRSTGEITKVNRGALYLGLGANAIGAGTVNIPGLVFNQNLSEIVYRTLVSRQVVRQREFASVAARNDVLLRVATAYVELLRAEGRRAIAVQNRDEIQEVARITANFAKAGQGRQADADRAATELEQRNGEVSRAEGDVLTASARLCQLLDLDPSVRLHATDGWVVPAPIVPDPIPLTELIAVALTQRPELKERQATVQAALLYLQGARLLPFSPNVILGYSAGTFGGGSNLASNGILQADGTVLRQPRFDSFGERQDFDAVVFWSVRNLGVGNVALVRLARSNLRADQLREIEVLDRVRAEVAAAHARTHARYAQIATAERAVQSGGKAFEEDLKRTKDPKLGLPIEVLDSQRLVGRGRYAYLDAISDYNVAQIELYVALGQPPASVLARPIPASLVPAAPESISTPPAVPK
jgi:outer membrane protein TolC